MSVLVRSSANILVLMCLNNAEVKTCSGQVYVLGAFFPVEQVELLYYCGDITVLLVWFLFATPRSKRGCTVPGRLNGARVVVSMGWESVMCSSRNSTPMAWRAVSEPGQCP